MGLDAAVDRFWEAADACQLGIDAIQVVAGNGRHGERRRIDDIRRDVFSVSKTVTSLAVGMLEGDGALSLDDTVLAHLPGLAGAAAAGSEAITVGHLLRMTAGNGYRWPGDDADHPGDPARDFLATRWWPSPARPTITRAATPTSWARSSTRSRGWTCATSWYPACSPRSASAIPSGCAARSASPSARSAFSCGPRKSPGSRNYYCTRAPTAATAWFQAITSPA